MTKKSQEAFGTILDSMCASPVYAEAARRAGISESTLYAWLTSSQRGEPGFIVEEFAGEANIPLHDAMRFARKIAVLSAVQRMEHRALNGHEEAVFFRGQPTWVEDERYAGLDQETLEILGLPDRYLRIDGRRVQHTMHVQPPVALVLAVAAANTKLYAQRQEINVNQRNSGVQVVEHRYGQSSGVALPAVQPTAIEPSPSISSEPDDDLSDIIGSEEAPSLAGEATPAQPPARPLSALEADLLSRLQRESPVIPCDQPQCAPKLGL
ncbi:hypothetical protein L6654_24195 [Bradyrhizobium sp. WYCCWR 13023]|uniref:Uncharacterized protein n=1 Tax=Bradyrhizobium zhengyangense TaxID=2911009 RepID=A0A9X1UBV0_9BRAD|nr:hypothetical protein [Bradyrhizobium zhengyangense]MCG2629729.1 hypothetical protein [Bradyrhizobium zhengyangense]